MSNESQSQSQFELLKATLEEQCKQDKLSHNALVHTIRNNDCREIIATTVGGEPLANKFVWAGGENDLDLLQIFLDNQMNVDVVDDSGWTALICAAFRGQEESVRLLLAHNATINFQDGSFGCTALMHTCSMGLEEQNVVKCMLENGADPDIQDKTGMTVLMEASRRGFKNVVELLLDHGAVVELKNDKGQKALDMAATKRIEELLANHVPSTNYVLK